MVVKKSSKKEYWLNGLIYGILGLLMFIPAFIISLIISWPQSYGSFIAFWLLLNSTASLLTLNYLKKGKKYKSNGELLSWKDFATDNVFSKNSNINIGKIGKSAILAIIIILWLYCWTIFIEKFFFVDFRVILPVFNDITVERLTIAPIYLPFALIFAFIEGLWLVGFLRTKNYQELNENGVWKKNFTKFSLKAIWIKIMPYITLLVIQLVGSFLLNKALIGGFLGFQLIFLYILIPVFAIGTLIICWSYKLTERVYVGVFIYTLLICWMAATLLPVTL